MPARPRIPVISRAQNLRAHNPSLKSHSNQQSTRSTSLKHTKKPAISGYATQSEEDEEPIQSSVSNKKPIPAPLIPQFLLNAQTFLGVRHVHSICKSVLGNTWIASQFFQQSLQEVEKLSEEHGTEAVMDSSIATISYKSMKASEIIKTHVPDANSWYDVESVIRHLAKSNLKGIRVDLSLKYVSKNAAGPVEVISDDDEPDLHENESNKMPKRPRHVFYNLYNC